MNKYHKIILFSFLLLATAFFVFAFVQNVSAAFEYEPMEGIPGFEDKTMGKKEPDLKVWIESTYKFFMWAVGICALFMITIGGFTYMTSAGNTSKAGVGKQIITDAIIGLILALVAVLLFTVINPNLTKVNLTINPAETKSDATTTAGTGTGATTGAGGTGATTGGTTSPVSSSSLSTAITSLRANSKVKIDGTGDCKDASGNEITPDYSLNQIQNGGTCSTACNSNCKSGSSPCSSCVAMKTDLLDAINTVGATYSLRVSSLTGGEHTTESTHYKGTAADIVPSTTDRATWSTIVAAFKSAGCSSTQTFCDDGKGSSPCSDSATDHIHITCS